MADNKRHLWTLAKALEGIGMVVILIGLVLSVQLGFRDEGMESQYAELIGLLAGLFIFGVGFLIERLAGFR
ncbi:MAG: hypothetical protein AAF368_04670 [Planctomycetota bacterium]